MRRVLVTGGTGVLGREVVQQCLERGSIVRVMSRGERQGHTPLRVEWAQADIATGVGMTAALADVDVVLHAATSPRQAKHVDVAGTRTLLAAARDAGVQHLVYVSIVGIDRIPLPFYRQKLETEQLVRNATIPWTILRATQFHQLLDEQVSSAHRWPLMVLPTDFRYQPIDPKEVATHLLHIVDGGPQHHVPDIGGPEVLTLGEIARTWLAANGIQRRIVHLPLPGKIAHAFRNGFNTCPDQRYGTVPWTHWIKHTAGSGFGMVATYDR